MTGRDLGWRLAGAALLAGGYAIGAFVDAGESALHSAAMLLGFVMAIAGLILTAQGKRVAAAIRVERSRHRLLPFAIRARRCRKPAK